MKIQKNTELAETLERLNMKIERLEQTISQLSKPVIEHVTIERVYVQNPVLERLEFGLDHLDIKDLSGALNLGNNFGVTVDHPLSKNKDRKETANKTKGKPEDHQEEKQKKNTHQKRVDEIGQSLKKEKTPFGFRFSTSPVKE